MNHHEALERMSVERYTLGELNGQARADFEDHLFDCAECTADLKASVAMLQGLRTHAAEAPAALPAPAAKPPRERRGWLRLFQPVWLVPALAASLAVTAFQSAVLLPGLRTEVAELNRPAVVESLSLAGATRGDQLPRVHAPAGGSFLLDLDIPPAGNYRGYRCLLVSPQGKVLWQLDIPREAVTDTVQIRVPAQSALAGENILRVQGLNGADAQPAELFADRFMLEIR